MYYLLIGLIVLASLLMCFIVLIQNSKGGGLSSQFASSNQIMGVRKTTDFIDKMTWTLAAIMVVLSVSTSYVLPKQMSQSSVIMEQAKEEVNTNPLNVPAGFENQGQKEEAPAKSGTPAESDARANENQGD